MPYTSQQSFALRMLQRKGVTMSLTQVAPQTVDPVTDVASAGVPQTMQVVAVASTLSVGRDLTFDQKSDLRKRQRLLTIAGLDANGNPLAFEPDVGQTIVFEGSTWTLGGFSCERPDGVTPIYYSGEVRR